MGILIACPSPLQLSFSKWTRFSPDRGYFTDDDFQYEGSATEAYDDGPDVELNPADFSPAPSARTLRKYRPPWPVPLVPPGGLAWRQLAALVPKPLGGPQGCAPHHGPSMPRKR